MIPRTKEGLLKLRGVCPHKRTYRLDEKRSYCTACGARFAVVSNPVLRRY
jgi:hypothetical protein